jgi:glyoxylase-like metal-dependent hydrolase (beta-lactamase superfamily II)
MDFVRANLLDSEGTTFQWIDDGDVIDLGGIQLEVIAMPGHSAGSVAYFDRANRICYTGSAVDMNVQVNNLDFYFNTPEHRALMPAFLGLADLDGDLNYAECFLLYADIVRRFVGIVGEDVTLYAGHTLLPQTINSAYRVIEACEQIAAGERDGDLPAESPFEYQRNTPEKYKRVHYAGNVGVIYDAAKFGTVAA